MASYEVIPLDELTLDPENVRKHPAGNLRAIQASLKRFGQQRPIIVDRRNVVVAGNGTVMAARGLGWTELQAQRTELEGDEAVAFAIADNRTAELAEWDRQALIATLGSLEELAGTGFTGDAFVSLQASVQTLDDSPEQLLRSKVVVRFATDEARAEFSELVGQPVTSKTRSINFPE